MRCQRGLLSAIIGQRVRCCHKWRVEWRLTTWVFDFVAVGGVGIVASGVGMSVKRAEVSCGGSTVFKDQEKHPGSSRSKDFAGLGNGQRHLIERQEEGES